MSCDASLAIEFGGTCDSDAMMGGLGSVGRLPLAYPKLDMAMLDGFFAVSVAAEETDTADENNPPDERSSPCLLETIGGYFDGPILGG